MRHGGPGPYSGTFASKYREYDGETGLTATIPAEPTQLEPFRLDLE